MPERKSSFTNLRTFIFVAVLCSVCALVLSVLAEVLREPQKNARELYRSKQLLLAARILSYDGTFLLGDAPARLEGGRLVAISTPQKAKDHEILALFDSRILTRLTDAQGNLYTFETAGIDEEAYLADNAKLGYAHLPYKLVYVVKANTPSPLPYGYVIPVNGYGLWDAIYGYLGIESNGNTVLGMTWYEQKETPGLGGEIALPQWQEQFFGKEIFQKGPGEITNFERASLGIKVVKTTVEETLGDSPKAASAVDGIAGASITITGVTEALRNSLAPYRQFLIRAHNGEITIDG